MSRVCGTFKERTGHPCQMPEGVLERIIRVASKPGDLVLDPFAGSGTTLAVAALSVIILRSGLLEIVPALATFAAALVLAALAVLLGFAAFIVIWRQGLRGLGSAIDFILEAALACLSLVIEAEHDIDHWHTVINSNALKRIGHRAA